MTDPQDLERKLRRRVVTAGILAPLCGQTAFAMSEKDESPPRSRAPAGGTSRLSTPQGPTLLTVTGGVSRGQVAARASFDREMLERLPIIQFVTGTPWSPGKRAYEGPRLRGVLDAAGAAGTRFSVRGLNDYSAVIPRSDVDSIDLMLALKIDGQPIRTRDKGPLLLMYPFDDQPALRNQIYYARAVWQVVSITVLE